MVPPICLSSFNNTSLGKIQTLVAGLNPKMCSKVECFYSIGCGKVDKVVGSHTRGSRFEPCHWQLRLRIHLLLTIKRKYEDKDDRLTEGMTHFIRNRNEFSMMSTWSNAVSGKSHSSSTNATNIEFFVKIKLFNVCPCPSQTQEGAY